MSPDDFEQLDRDQHVSDYISSWTTRTQDHPGLSKIIDNQIGEGLHSKLHKYEEDPSQPAPSLIRNRIIVERMIMAKKRTDVAVTTPNKNLRAMYADYIPSDRASSDE